jgi:hypothetical protein
VRKISDANIKNKICCAPLNDLCFFFLKKTHHCLSSVCSCSFCFIFKVYEHFLIQRCTCRRIQAHAHRPLNFCLYGFEHSIDDRHSFLLLLHEFYGFVTISTTTKLMILSDRVYIQYIQGLVNF